MGAARLFGTDGIRGVANQEPVTPETALRFGRAVAQLCLRSAAPRPGIVVGRDTRLSGDMLESALVAGICSTGADALLAGILPTPGVAFLTRRLQAGAGIVISASHNSFEDNGLKIFAHSGFKLPDAAEREIEALMQHEDLRGRSPTAADVGRVRRLDDAGSRYVTFLRSSFPPSLSLEGVNVALDCAHGAAYQVAPRALMELGANVVTIGASPDGANINRTVGALHPQQLQETVRAHGADLGIALDGDADRAILVDERGDIVDGDEVLAMLATDMLAQGTLPHATVVGTVMSNIGLETALRARGARLVRVPVGDRYVIEAMLQHGYTLGGEQSGHLILLEHSTTGDGLVASLAVLRLMVQREHPLSDLKRAMRKLPQVLLNVPVGVRCDLETVAPVREAIARVRAGLNERGRVLVRYSGTEPLIRVMVEGEDRERITAYAEEIGAVLKAHLTSSR